MSAAKRLQFNIDLLPIPEIEVMKNVPEMIFPLMWVEEGADLNKTFVNMLKYQLFLLVFLSETISFLVAQNICVNVFLCFARGLKYQSAVKWLSLFLGPVGMAISAFLDYQRRHVVAFKVQTILASKNKPEAAIEANDVSSATTQEMTEKERF